MAGKFPSITAPLATAINQAAQRICAGRVGFDCEGELTPPKVRVIVAEISPELVVQFDATPRHEIKEFLKQSTWWK